jgi:hypothetical protein
LGAEIAKRAINFRNACRDSSADFIFMDVPPFRGERIPHQMNKLPVTESRVSVIASSLAADPADAAGIFVTTPKK